MTWFRNSYTETRFSVFSYKTEAIFSLFGLQDVAVHLLEEVVNLRRNDEEVGEFVSIYNRSKTDSSRRIRSYFFATTLVPASSNR